MSKSPELRLDQIVTVRFTEAERTLVRKAAKKQGYPESVWVREVILATVKKGAEITRSLSK